MTSLATMWRRADWRILMGVILTFIWMVLGLTYLIGAGVSGRTIFDIPLENLGSFLEGAFAPLAFLWLVIGLFVQQKELSDNTEVLRLSLDHAAEQTQALAAAELNARQETFFKIAESVKRQLGGISGMLYASALADRENGNLTGEKIRDMFHSLSIGDAEIFAREFLILDPEPYGGYPELFYGTDIRRRHSENFRRSFERLMALGEDLDIDGIIVDSLIQTGLGIFYQRLMEMDPKQPEIRYTAMPIGARTGPPSG